MRVQLTERDLRAVEAHGESAYPDEGAGFLLGRTDGETCAVEVVLPMENQREAEARYNRYELAPADFLQAELDAARRGLDLVGVFHSHPDHPARPSEFDREHALPHFCYLITSVVGGQAGATHAWRLRGDRAAFDEDDLVVIKTVEDGGEV